jgi:hypothetical protein
VIGALAAIAATWSLLVVFGANLAEGAQHRPEPNQLGGQAMPNDDTERLISILQGQPEYVMDFMADFGGDPEEYIPVQDPSTIDFSTITVNQLGDALRQFVETAPPDGLPPDLNLGDVSWVTVGGSVDHILSGFYGSL